MIRLATQADIADMLAIYAPYVLDTTCSFEYTVPTEAEFTARLCKYTRSCPWLVWEEQGRILGYAYAMPAFERAAFAWCAELSVYLRPEARGKGIGRRLYTALEKLLLRQGYKVLYALITDENEPSLAFHRTLGYRIVGRLPGCGIKFSRRCGLVWMEKQAEFVDIPTNPPIAWPVFVENNRNIQNILDNLSLS